MEKACPAVPFATMFTTKQKLPLEEIKALTSEHVVQDKRWGGGSEAPEQLFDKRRSKAGVART